MKSKELLIDSYIKRFELLVHNGFGDGLDEASKAIHKASFSDLRDRLRLVVLDNTAKSYLPGIIFTGAMYYDNEDVWKITNSYIDTFRNAALSIGEQTRLLIVELSCDIEERYKRNASENRLLKKPSKRNLEWSKKDIEKQLISKRIEANQDDIQRFNADQFIKIDNTTSSAYDTAKQIVKIFNL